jgi:serine protease Do
LITRSFTPHLLPLVGLLTILPAAHGASLASLPSGTVPAPPTTPQEKSTLLQMQDSFTKIAQTVEPTVVNIKSERASPTSDIETPLHSIPIPKILPKGHAAPGIQPPPGHIEATGSGVIVRPDGYILTNDHVVDGARGGMVTVTLSDGREFQGKVYPDYRSDLAIVKINPGTVPLPVATFTDSNQVEPGQWAIAVGSPFDLQNTMTVGVISALNREQTISGDSPGQERYYPDLIQTDAAINPGNSGGPLFNLNGQVVGINVAIESPVEGNSGVGFAIPSDIAQQIMQTLITQGKVVRGQLGVVPQDLTPALAQTYGQKQGAFLSDVLLKSPAGDAGLQAADIITSFDGKPITGELDLRTAISNTPPHTKVQIGYVRDSKPGIVNAIIGAAPPDPSDLPAQVTPADSDASHLGLKVRDLDARDRVTLSLPPMTTGVLDIGAEADSVSDQAGLGQPDAVGKIVVQRVNQTPVTNQAEFDQAVAALPAGSMVTLIILSSQQNELHQSAITLQL